MGRLKLDFFYLFFCQQNTSFSSVMLKQAIEEVEQPIRRIENNILNDEETGNNELHTKRLELRSLLQEKVKGALVRSQYIQLKDMDASSTFFFNLEKTSVKDQRMTCLRCLDGHVTTDGVEMRCAMYYYTKLYDKEQCVDQCVQDLLESLPQLCESEKVELDKEISLEELTTAVDQLASGHGPGLDGLTIDFYKHFWSVIGSDLHEVLMSSYDDNVLPASCRRAVLTLLPKKARFN